MNRRKWAATAVVSSILTLSLWSPVRSGVGQTYESIRLIVDVLQHIQTQYVEERDVQVRGYKVRLPLDILLVASANPEDYTNRGRIITPLKDRFGAQIRTHYPLEVATEVAIAQQESTPFEVEGVEVTIPDWMDEVVATFSHLARGSSNISQRSGVSVRLTVTNR